MTTQPSLFSGGASERPDQLGDVQISYRESSSILTRASGFMDDYDFTLNPYSGCGFGCTYCYAAFFATDADRQDDWGRWVDVKSNALQKLQRMRTDLHGKTVYMSSVTDPYQLIERRLELVRDLLPPLAERGVRLVVQTRSPLATRDIDLFKRFEHIRVNITVTTDSEEVRKTFEPRCPPNERRLEAAAEIHAAGVPTSITMTPLLPVADPEAFAVRLLETEVQDFVVQPFHANRGRFVAGTREDAIALVERFDWNDDRYASVVQRLRDRLPNLAEGRSGFRPA